MWITTGRKLPILQILSRKHSHKYWPVHQWQNNRKNIGHYTDIKTSSAGKNTFAKIENTGRNLKNFKKHYIGSNLQRWQKQKTVDHKTPCLDEKISKYQSV